jgi:hypothetical protein
MQWFIFYELKGIWKDSTIDYMSSIKIEFWGDDSRLRCQSTEQLQCMQYN